MGGEGEEGSICGGGLEVNGKRRVCPIRWGGKKKENIYSSKVCVCVCDDAVKRERERERERE